MKKLLIALAAVAALSACEQKTSSGKNTGNIPGVNNLEFSVICLEGVRYWVHITDDYQEAIGLMSPMIDATTLQPSRCQ